MAFDCIIRRAVLHRPDGATRADVGILNGRIAAIAPRIADTAGEEVDARGADLLPGLIDPHVHLRNPGGAHKETWRAGAAAAVCGGVTTVLDMPNTSPPTTDLDRLEAKHRLVADDAWCDFGFFVAATEAGLPRLAEALADPRVPGLKLYIGSTTGDLLVERRTFLRKLAETLKGEGFDKPVAVHGELESTLRQLAGAPGGAPRPHHLARPAVSGADGMAFVADELAGLPLHLCHLSTVQEVRLLARLRRSGVDITGEVCPHHLLLDARRDEQRLGSLARMNPPLRHLADREALMNGLRHGIIDMLATDHAPHARAEKSGVNPPSGVPGLDTLLRTMLLFVRAGRLTLQEVVRLGADAPARRFGLRGKGRLDEGADADMVLLPADWRATPLTPLGAAELHTACGWSPFQGFLLPPAPAKVWLRGRLVARDGRLSADTPTGAPVTTSGK